jgi:hypothetical protein
MVSSGMLGCVALVRRATWHNIPEGFLQEPHGITSQKVLTRATRRNIPEDDILHSHRRENLKSYLMSHVNVMLEFWI